MMTLIEAADLPVIGDAYRADAREHLWRHFAEMAEADRVPLRIIEHAEGCYLTDTEGNRFLDGLSGLFCVNIGYSYGEEIGQAALEQYRTLPYAASWGTTHPRAIELASKVSSLAPEGLNHVFFTPSGGESVEAAWKIARQYHLLRGEHRWKAIARDNAYHGTTMGALTLLGIPGVRAPFEPLVNGAHHVRNTRRLGRPAGETEEEFTAFLLEDMERAIRSEDPSTVAMIIVEPVQNHGGMLTPPAGYAEGLRAIADKYGILLVADETITAFGRLGEWFASARFGFQPDIITTAKGLSSAHAVIGAVIVSDRVYEPFAADGASLLHGNTFGGHPVMTAVALKNIEIIERLELLAHVRERQADLEAGLRSLLDLPVVADVRGAGYFWAVELSSVLPSGVPMSESQLAEVFSDDALRFPLEAEGVLLRLASDGGDPVICVAPPLVADHAEFDHLTTALRRVLQPLSDKIAAL